MDCGRRDIKWENDGINVSSSILLSPRFRLFVIILPD